ncbi:MAG: tRNA (adenosine(37)-N6)-dimethylallyltransferase MiaA [Gammaproteobacteria bacterium]|nr:tRNA (adenosine(37)-N6)-dimethylallyltransferase MiaA [Gammaproteobacteria bacterium]|tara:strand:- start:69842 stop:70792 length:951 start_codon:yes stop_codon:yes gene_type:complete
MKYKYNIPAVFILGPTACGKTEISLELIDSFPFEIVSVDSAMVYKDMNIGTCKPSNEILKSKKHHLVDLITPKQNFDLGVFLKNLDHSIEEILSHDCVPLFVGGSMMYHHILLNGFHDFPSEPNIKQRIQNDYDQNGITSLQKKLSSLDSELFTQIDISNYRRVIRALEIIEITGEKLSVLKEKQKTMFFNQKKCLTLSLNTNKETLIEHAANRLDKLIEKGFIDEFKEIICKYELEEEDQSMQSINYRQYFNHVRGKKSSQESYTEAMIATKLLIKSQQTWLKKINADTSIDSTNINLKKEISDTISNYQRRIMR